MKTYTEREIFDYLVANVALALEYDDVRYVVRIDENGCLVGDGRYCPDACIISCVVRDPEQYLGVSREEYDETENVDAFYRKEKWEDSDFREIVTDLTEKVNAAIREIV